jgi:hypothetical protein
VHTITLPPYASRSLPFSALLEYASWSEPSM